MTHPPGRAKVLHRLGAGMTTASHHHEADFSKRVREILHEIERHKWLESEKVGRDIGGNRAARDWLDRHYELCKKHRGYHQ